MREILFRGKRITDGKLVEGMPVANSAGEIYAIMKFNSEMEILEIGSEVEQYTGLTDKNRKKIFEGDIFKFPDEVWESSYTSCGTEWDSWEVENYGVIGFDEYTARFDFVQYRYNENSVEADLHENNCLEFAEFVKKLKIIGNIHDNPELLGGEDNDT